MLLLSFALAAEPSSPAPGTAPVPTLPGATVVRLSWSELSWNTGGPDLAPFGPDHLAAGPDGAWAVHDPVRGLVVTSGADIPLRRVSDLAFTTDGDLLAYDSATRSIGRFAPDGTLRARVALPGLVPTSIQLRLSGGVVWGQDALGNLHPVLRLDGGAIDPRALERPPHRVVREGTTLVVDGRPLGQVPGLVGARLVDGGDWLVVEARDAAGVVTRSALGTDGRSRVDLPGDARLYRAADDLSVAPDGSLWWLDPTPSGLDLHRVAP